MVGPAGRYEQFPALERRHERAMKATDNRVAYFGKKESREDGKKGAGSQEMNISRNNSRSTTRPTASLRSMNLELTSMVQPTVAIIALPWTSKQSSHTLDTAPSTTLSTRPTVRSSSSKAASSSGKFQVTEVALAQSTPKPIIPAISSMINEINRITLNGPQPTLSIALLINNGGRLDSSTPPGIKQYTEKPNPSPATTTLAKSQTSVQRQTMSAIVVAKPMPGRNQPKPIMGEAAAASFIAAAGLASTSTLSLPSTTSQTMASMAPSSLSVISLSGTFSPTRKLESELPGAFTTPSKTLIVTPTSFVTLTRTENVKAPTSLQASSSSQGSFMVQSVSSILSSTIAFTSILEAPTDTPEPSSVSSSEIQQSPRIGPPARTVFIILGVLGAVAVLIAIAVLMISRAKRARHPSQIRRPSIDPSTRSVSQYSQSENGGTIHIAADESVRSNPFLTESEKAIVARAASPDGESSPKPSSSLADAVNSFIAKSRQLSYKISP